MRPGQIAGPVGCQTARTSCCFAYLLDTGWTIAGSGGKLRCMPSVDLSATELETAVRACRAMAHQEGARAKTMENLTTRPPIEAAAQRYAALAEKFERARKRA